MPTLDRITLFPVKSLDGVVVREARLLAGGGLEHDRRWQFADLEGRVVNAKRHALLHAIRAEFSIQGLAGEPSAGGELPSLAANVIGLAVDPAALDAGAVPGIERLAHLGPDVFPLVPGSAGPCGWLSEALGFEVRLFERRDGGFPDDCDAPGPTLAATATLAEVARWFGFELGEARRRFRVNLEIGGCEAFWEDSLASPARPELEPSCDEWSSDLPADPYADLPPPEGRFLAIGSGRLRAVNVCRRCVVPSRDSRTAAVTDQFRDIFEARRARSIRPDVDAAAWITWYRLAVNTLGEAGTVARGDEVWPA
jgi:uncharacterized protein YcbX